MDLGVRLLKTEEKKIKMWLGGELYVNDKIK